MYTHSRAGTYPPRAQDTSLGKEHRYSLFYHSALSIYVNTTSGIASYYIDRVVRVVLIYIRYLHTIWNNK